MQFRTFLQALHRRMVVVRLAERIGISVLAATVVALLAVGLLLWHARPIGLVAELCTATGLVAGTVWGIIRRPVILQAALLADEQLNSSDVILTAYVCHGKEPDSTDPWLGQINDQANRQCASRSPGSLKVSRVGGRMWGVIVLSAALLSSVEILAPSIPGNSIQHAGQSAGGANSLASGTNDRVSPVAFVSTENRPILLADPDDPNASRFGQNPAEHAAPDSTAAKSNNPNADKSVAAGEAGYGGGSARTDVHPQNNNLPADAHAGAGNASPDASAKIVAGAGAASGITTGSEPSASGLTVGSAPAAAAQPPPWEGHDWPADVTRAQSALTAGSIPAQYRDLIRGYFAPPE